MSAASVAMLPQPTPLPAKLFTLSAAAEIVSSVKAASEICCQVTLAYGATQALHQERPADAEADQRIEKKASFCEQKEAKKL